MYLAPLSEWGPVNLTMRDAALALGYPWSDDCNAPDATGVSPYPINARNGVRISPMTRIWSRFVIARICASWAMPWSIR